MLALVAPASARAAGPPVIVHPGRALTGPSSAAPAARAEAYVRDHASALGLTGADVDALGTPARTTAPGGLQIVRWTQSYRGIPVFRGGVKVNLDRSGRVLGVAGGARHAVRVASVVPALSAWDALHAAGRTSAVASGPAGAEQVTTFTNRDKARLVVYGDQLAWDVIAGSREVVVDAAGGAQLFGKSLTRDAAAANVWENFPGAALGGTAHAVDLEALGYLAPGAGTLSNADVHVYSHPAIDTDDNGSDPGVDIARNGAGGYDFTFQKFAGDGCSDARQCSWNSAPGQRSDWVTNQQQTAVEAFYFANKYLAHLRTLVPGFQNHDALQVRTDDGASDVVHFHDNANMTTFPDRTSSIMRMYLWGLDAGQRAVNGGDDAAILFHEYTHELNDRLVPSLDGPEGGAMDEGMADFQAASYLTDNGYSVDTAAPGEVDMGTYTDTEPHVIRTEAIDCPVGQADAACPAGGYTFGDFGRVLGGPEVHADGEIWGQTLWDLRQAVGQESEQIVANALQAVSAAPGFLDMRNAILTATQALDPGHVNDVWQVFARRGMGYYASVVSSSDTSPQEDFQRPPSGVPGSIAGIVTDGDTGAPIQGVRVSISGNTRFAATTDASGGYVLPAAPDTYQRIVFKGAAAYDVVTVAGVTVAANQATPLNQVLRRNWAGAAGGATISSGPVAGGCGANKTIDGDPTTGWSAQWTAPHPELSMTVKLSGAADLTRFEALPAPVCLDSASAAAKGYRIEVSRDGGTFTTVLQGEFTNPGSFSSLALDDAGKAAAQGTRWVRLTLLSPQDASSGDGMDWIDLAEFRAFGPTGTAVTPTPTAVVTPAATPTAVPTATPTPPARPAFSLRSSAKRSGVFTVTCAATCSVTGKLTIDAKTAKRLKLGKTRTIGSLTQSVKAGKKTLTLILNLKARRAFQRAKQLKSFKATLTVSARYPGAAAVTAHRTVKITR